MAEGDHDTQAQEQCTCANDQEMKQQDVACDNATTAADTSSANHDECASDDHARSESGHDQDDAEKSKESQEPQQGAVLDEMDDDDMDDDGGRLASRKIFVGGLSWETTEDDLRGYFGKFGEVLSCQVKYDAASKQPRGFGFVVFDTEDSVHKVLDLRDQHLVRGKRVDPKPAKPSKDVCRKVFVGGIDPCATYEDILAYFTQFGKVESLDLPFDSAKACRKNYVFIAYASKHEALAASRSERQFICGRMCDVRVALPRDQILKMRCRSVGQACGNFAAPQTLANKNPRNFSAPSQFGAAGSNSNSNLHKLDASRCRDAYRSGYAANNATNMNTSTMMYNHNQRRHTIQFDAFPQFSPSHYAAAASTVQCPCPSNLATPYAAVPTNPPFQLMMQNAPNAPTNVAIPGHFPAPPHAAPYQVCLVNPPTVQPTTAVYTPYYVPYVTQPNEYTTNTTVSYSTSPHNMQMTAAATQPQNTYTYAYAPQVQYVTAAPADCTAASNVVYVVPQAVDTSNMAYVTAVPLSATCAAPPSTFVQQVDAGATAYANVQVPLVGGDACPRTIELTEQQAAAAAADRQNERRVG